MPLLGFTVCKAEIKDGRKQQTIRAFRKRSFQIDDQLFIHWHLRQKDCEKFGEAPLTQLFLLSPSEMRHCEEIAHWDGFSTAVEMWAWFQERAKDLQKQFEKRVIQLFLQQLPGILFVEDVPQYDDFATEDAMAASVSQVGEAILAEDPILYYYGTTPDPFFTVIRFAPDWIPEEQHLFPKHFQMSQYYHPSFSEISPEREIHSRMQRMKIAVPASIRQTTLDEFLVGVAKA